MLLFALILLGLVLILLIYMRFEAGFVEVKKVKFTTGSSYLKILQLSDIHIGRLAVPTQKVKKIIESEDPHLLIMTGDYIEKREHMPRFLKFLDSIKGAKCILLGLGNHDYEAFMGQSGNCKSGPLDKNGLELFLDEIKKRGVTVLHDKSICFSASSAKYNIIGFADYRFGSPDIQKALKSCCNDSYIKIGFSHNPDIVLDMPRGSVDYMFCGHTHGGQIWMFGFEFWLLRRDRLPKMGIKSGLHRLNAINLYINRGLGNVCVPLRFLSRPEITVFHLPLPQHSVRQ